jgi:hypothetical protein
MPNYFTHIAHGEHGQTSVEYATVLLFAVLVLVFALATAANGLLDGVGAKVIAILP